MNLSFSHTWLVWMMSVLLLSISMGSGTLFAFSLPSTSQNTHINPNAQNDTEKSHHSHHCKRGPRGHKGQRGKRGYPGATGPMGATGTTGPGGIPIYASLYSDESTPFPIGTIKLPFNNVSITNGDISFSPTHDSITIGKTGVYEINIGILSPQAIGSDFIFNLYKNNSPIPGTSISATVIVLNPKQYTNSIITNLDAGDILSLRLTLNGIPAALPGGCINAYITIKEIE